MPKTYLVEIIQFAYKPPSLVIEAGDKVKWINRDSTRHTATRPQAPTFDTGLLSKDQESAEIVFPQASDSNGFVYICTPHPFMTAKIVVTLPGSHLESYSHVKPEGRSDHG